MFHIKQTLVGYSHNEGKQEMNALLKEFLQGNMHVLTLALGEGEDTSPTENL